MPSRSFLPGLLSVLVTAGLGTGCATLGDDPTLAAKLKTSGVTSLSIMTRGQNVSIAKIGTETAPQTGGEDGASKLLRACYDIAKTRGAQYFVVLAQGSGARSLTTVGFTNDPKPNIQNTFGKEYSATDKAGRPLQIFSVAEIAKTIETSDVG